MLYNSKECRGTKKFVLSSSLRISDRSLLGDPWTYQFAWELTLSIIDKIDRNRHGLSSFLLYCLLIFHVIAVRLSKVRLLIIFWFHQCSSQYFFSKSGSCLGSYFVFIGKDFYPPVNGSSLAVLSFHDLDTFEYHQVPCKMSLSLGLFCIYSNRGYGFAWREIPHCYCALLRTCIREHWCSYLWYWYVSSPLVLTLTLCLTGCLPSSSIQNHHFPLLYYTNILVKTHWSYKNMSHIKPKILDFVCLPCQQELLFFCFNGYIFLIPSIFINWITF